MVDIHCAAVEIRRGKKDRKKPLGKNIMSAPAMQGGHKQYLLLPYIHVRITVRTKVICLNKNKPCSKCVGKFKILNFYDMFE